jgi:hypothetical protein
MIPKLLTIAAFVICISCITVNANPTRKLSLMDSHGDEDSLEGTAEVLGFWTRHLSASMSMGKKGLFIDRRHLNIKGEPEGEHSFSLKNGGKNPITHALRGGPNSSRKLQAFSEIPDAIDELAASNEEAYFWDRILAGSLSSSMRN